jgi:hypothetical protein
VTGSVNPLHPVRAVFGSAAVLVLAVAAGPAAARPAESVEVVDVPLRVESRVPDVSTEELTRFVSATLDDPRSWSSAGFRFRVSPDAPFRVVLAEGPEVDRLCAPLRTASKVSCQNGPVVALNADRWRVGVGEWDAGIEEYRHYVVNHEVGHLVGQRHPEPRCPDRGALAAVMEQQTKGLVGCRANGWPLWWELERAAARPAVLAPPPEWGPSPVPVNRGGEMPSEAEPAPGLVVDAGPAAPQPMPVPMTTAPLVATESETPTPTTQAATDEVLALAAAGAASADDVSDVGRSGRLRGPVLAVLGVAVSVVMLLAVRRRPRSRPSTRPFRTTGERGADWEIRMSRGGAQVGRDDRAAWVLPGCWSPLRSTGFVDHVVVALRGFDEPRELLRQASAALAVGDDPVDGAGAAVVVDVDGSPRALVVGRAELVVEERDRRHRHRNAVLDLHQWDDVARFGIRLPDVGSDGGAVLFHRTSNPTTRPTVEASDG